MDSERKRCDVHRVTRRSWFLRSPKARVPLRGHVPKHDFFGSNRPFMARIPTRIGATGIARRDGAAPVGPKACGPL